MNAQMRGQKLNRERRKRIVAPVIDAIVFGIPFGDDDIVFQRRLEKPMEMQRSISTTYAASLKACSTSPYSKTPFQTRFVPSFFVENAVVGERLFSVDHGLERFVLDLHQFGGVVGKAGDSANYSRHRLSLITHFGDSQRENL